MCWCRLGFFRGDAPKKLCFEGNPCAARTKCPQGGARYSPHLKSLRPFAAPIKANAALFDIRVALVRRLFALSHSSPHSSRIYRSRIVQHNFVAPSRRVALRRNASRSATRFAARTRLRALRVLALLEGSLRKAVPFFGASNPNRCASHHSARSSASHHKLRSHTSRRKSPAVLHGVLTAFSA